MSGSRPDSKVADHATQNTSKVNSCAGKLSRTNDLAHEYVSHASILVESCKNQTVRVLASTRHLRSCEYTRLYFRRPWLKFSALCLDQKRLLVGHLTYQSRLNFLFLKAINSDSVCIIEVGRPCVLRVRIGSFRCRQGFTPSFSTSFGVNLA